jgi:hypothetical protein
MADQDILVSIVASPEVIQELQQVAASGDVEFSEPVSVESPADALDAPIGGEEFRQILEMITVVFKTVAAAVSFALVLKKVLKKYPKEKATLKDHATGADRGTVTADSPPEEVRRGLVGP